MQNKVVHPILKKLCKTITAIILLYGFFILLRIFCITVSTPIPTIAFGESMSPTLNTPALVFVNQKMVPTTGAVVYVNDSHVGSLCKRIAAIGPCDISLKDGHFINITTGEDLGCAVYSEAFDSDGFLHISEKEVFLLGDNRTCSKDSSTFGAVPLSSVLGVISSIPAKSCKYF